MPEHLYLLDGNLTDTGSVGSQNATWSSGDTAGYVSSPSPYEGQFAGFDGSEFVDVPVAVQSGQTAFTMACRVKFDATNGLRLAISGVNASNTTSTNLTRLYLGVNGGQAYGRVNNQSAIEGGSVGTTSAHHLALTYTSSTARLYLDGTLIGSSGGRTGTAVTHFSIGAYTAQQFLNGTFFVDGQIGDVAFYHEELDGPAIAALAASTDRYGTYPAGLGPSNTTPAVIEQVGRTLQLQTAGVWDGAPPPTLSYKWQLNTGGGFFDIPGETDETGYTVPDADAGDYRLAERAINPSGDETENSNAITVAAAASSDPPSLTTAPVIVATGRALTLQSPGFYDNGVTSRSYQWLRGGSIVVSTALSYVVPDEDSGVYTLRETASNANGSAPPATSNAISLNIAPPTNLSAGSTSGELRVGSIRTATPGSWDDNGDATVASTWTWQRADDASGTNTTATGGTSQSYTLAAADLGKYVRVVERRTNNGGFDAGEDTATAWVGPVLAAADASTYWDLLRDPDCIGAYALPDRAAFETDNLRADQAGSLGTLAVSPLTPGGSTFWDAVIRTNTGAYQTFALGGDSSFEGENASNRSDWALKSANNMPSGSAARTLLVRVYVEDSFDPLGLYRYIVGSGDHTSDGAGFHIAVQSDDFLGTNTRVRIDHGGGTRDYGTLTLNTWHSIAAVVPAGATSTDDIIVYVDGVASSGTQSSGSARTLNTDAAGLTLNYPERWDNLKHDRIDGRYAEVYAFDRALSAAEVGQYHDGPEPLHDDANPPTIGGTPAVGSTLTANVGGAFEGFNNGSVSFTRQWVRSTDGFATETVVSGDLATDQPSYTVQASDAGFDIAIRERYTNQPSGFDDFEDRLSTPVTIPGAAVCPTESNGWPLDGTLDDTIGSNDGTVQRGSIGYASRPAGFTGDAVDFQGDELIGIPATIAQATNTAGTLMAWVRPDATTARATVFSMVGGGFTGAYLGYESSTLWARVNGSSATLITGGSITAGNAVHIALTWDGTGSTGYVNGVPVGSGDAKLAATYDTNSSTIGGWPGPNGNDHLLHVDGLVWDARVYTRRLGDAEVAKVQAGDCPLPPSVVTPNEINLVSPVRHQVFQRLTDSAGTIAIEATGTQGQSAQARFTLAGATPGSWTSIGTFGAGALNYNLAGQPTGRGTLEIRLTNDTGVTDSAADVAVGMVVVGTGQSNSLAEGRHDNPQTYTPTSSQINSSIFDEDGGWIAVATGYQDPTPPNPSTDYSIVPRLAPCLEAKFGVPVGFVLNGVGGTRIDEWQKGGSNYNSLLATYNAAGTEGWEVATIDIGESDAFAGTTQASFEADLQAIISDWRTDTGNASGKWVVAKTGFSNGADLTAVLAAQSAVIAADANVYERPQGTRASLHWGEGQGAGNEAEDEQLKDLWCNALSVALGLSIVPDPFGAADITFVAGDLGVATEFTFTLNTADITATAGDVDSSNFPRLTLDTSLLTFDVADLNEAVGVTSQFFSAGVQFADSTLDVVFSPGSVALDTATVEIESFGLNAITDQLLEGDAAELEFTAGALTYAPTSFPLWTADASFTPAGLDVATGQVRDLSQADISLAAGELTTLASAIFLPDAGISVTAGDVTPTVTLQLPLESTLWDASAGELQEGITAGVIQAFATSIEVNAGDLSAVVGAPSVIDLDLADIQIDAFEIAPPVSDVREEFLYTVLSLQAGTLDASTFSPAGNPSLDFTSWELQSGGVFAAVNVPLAPDVPLGLWVFDRTAERPYYISIDELE